MPNVNQAKQCLLGAAALCALLSLRLAVAEEPKPAAPTDAQIKEWIKQLGDQEFQKRNDARAALTKAGTAAQADLKAALESTDPEIKKVASEILAKLQWQTIPANINYLKLFPDESLYAIQFSHLEKTVEAAKKTAIGKLLAGEDLKPIADLIFKKAQEKGGENGKAGFDKFMKYAAQTKGQVAGAVWGINFREPGGLGAALIVELPSADPEKDLKEFLADTGFLAGGPETDENGLRVISGPRPAWAPANMEIPTGAIALVGRHLIVAPNLSSLKKVAEGLLKSDGGNLADSTLFKKVQPSLGASPDMIFCMNMQAYLRMMTNLAGPQAGEAMGKLGYDGLELFAWSTTINGDAFEERFSLVNNEKAKGMSKIYELVWASTKPLKEKLAQVPADAAMVTQNFMDGSVVFQFATDYMKQIAQMQEGMGAQPKDYTKMLEELESKIGVKMADLAGCIKGDMVTWAVLTQEEGTAALPDIGVSIECPDEAKAQQLAQGLFDVMQKVPSMFDKKAEAPPAVKPKDGDPPAPNPPPVNPTPEKAEDAVVKIERDGRSYFTESSKGPLVTKFEARQALPYRFTWTAKGSRVILASSAPYLNKRLSQIEKNAPGLDAAKFLSPEMKPEEIKSLLGIDMAAVLEYSAKLGLPMLAARMEKEPELQEKIAALAQKNGVFKSIPPLTVTAGVPKDGVSTSFVRSPLPYLPTAFAIGGLWGFMRAGGGAGAPPPAVQPPPPAPGF